MHFFVSGEINVIVTKNSIQESVVSENVYFFSFKF